MADQLRPFTCTYRYERRPIDVTVHARSWEEASARLRAIGMTARIDVGRAPKVGPLRAYPCCYEFEGVWSGLLVAARSREDAAERFRAIGRTAVVNGEQVKEIGAGVFGEGLGRALTAARRAGQ
ncbi:hypothetical protein [Shinella sp. BYT-45]|uniref:hypothetical protein n=1 Tax=Shinella sp. BYT-45 TaxID=3377377 RepID=UPI0039809CA3